MLAEIREDLKERMSTHVNSMCATDDEVRLAWLLCQVEKLGSIVSEVHAWAVCGAITTPDDMAQNFPRIVEITSPDFTGLSDLEDELETARESLDCTRRDFNAVLEEARMLRRALVGLIGASTKNELENMKIIISTIPAPGVDRAVALYAINALLDSIYSAPATPVEVDRTHEECAHCALSTKEPAICGGHPAGPVACPGFKVVAPC